MGQAFRLTPIELSPYDVASLNSELQSALEDAAGLSNSGEDTTPEDFHKQLRRLAELGNYAFKQFFGDGEAIQIIQDLWALDDPLSIQLVSEDFSLPWELMYPASPSHALTYEHFWGMRHILSRVIVQQQRGLVVPTIQIPSRPRLGLMTLISEELPAVREREIPFFEKLDEDGKIALVRLRALEIGRWPQELEEFMRFWRCDFHLAHLACHGFFEDSSPMHSHIRISDDFVITLKDLVVYNLNIAGHPLVVMNACQTGALNPLYTSSFAAAFLKYGALGVVTSEGVLPDTFAAEFAEQLYTRLLAGECLGSSLLACRKYFLKLRNDPSGLLYSMYAPPTIRFQIGGASG
jgi:CHAT domain